MKVGRKNGTKVHKQTNGHWIPNPHIITPVHWLLRKEAYNWRVPPAKCVSKPMGKKSHHGIQHRKTERAFVACSSWNQRSKGIFCDTKSPQGGPVMDVRVLGPWIPCQKIELQKSFDKNFNYIPGSPMTSIFEGQPPKNKALFKSKQGAPFGFQVYIQTYITILSLIECQPWIQTEYP